MNFLELQSDVNFCISKKCSYRFQYTDNKVLPIAWTLKHGSCKISNNYKTWVNKIPSNICGQGIWGSVILSEEWAGNRNIIIKKDSYLKLKHQFILTIEAISWWVVIKIMSSIYLSTSHFAIYLKHIGGVCWFVLQTIFNSYHDICTIFH